MEQSPDKKDDNAEKQSLSDNAKDTLKGFFKSKGKENKEKERFDYSKKFLGTSQIVENHNEIKKMASNLLSANQTIQNAKTENFKQAMERMGTHTSQLPIIHKNYLISFYISIVAFAFTLLFGLHLGVSGNGILPMLSCFSIAGLCFANAFRFSFRCFQIKYRKLCSIQDFLKNKEFFPFPISK